MAKLLTAFKGIATKSGKAYQEVKAKSDGRLFWSGSALVTYMVDTNDVRVEEFESGASVISPTFEPKKDGYIFVGWREDSVASSDVIYSKTMEGEPITLYAVFVKEIILAYYDNSTVALTTSGYNFYNNGNNAYPWFTLTQADKAGWIARGWATNSAADADVVFPVTLDGYLEWDITVYGLYEKDITLSYDGNGADSGSVASESKKVYFNSIGNYEYPEFVLKDNAFAKTDYIFNGWDLGAVGESVVLEADTVAYAKWVSSVVEPFTLTMNVASFSNTVNTNGSVYGNAYPSAESPYWYLEVGHDGGSTWTYATSTTSPFNRKNCTKCKFSCFIEETDGAQLLINNDAYDIVGGENIIDISGYGDQITVSLRTGATPEYAAVQISAPYFY